MHYEIRDIRDLEGCRAVVDVQLDVWGRDAETVPASLLIASAKRGGILIGAWSGSRLVGFVWSMPGTRAGKLTHWSHMLGVRRDARGAGLGTALKRAQADRARAAGVELIEWTFDPLQAPNAHLNLSVLGCTASEYRVNAYGEMSGPLHRGTPTDRLVAEWCLAPARGQRPIADDASVARIAVPPNFGEMQATATEQALRWRLETREAFSKYFGLGYRAVGFELDRESGGGTYLLRK